MNDEIIYVYIVSLGCSKNFIDTEVMAAALITHNIGITDDPDEASIYLINTCAFIPPARSEAEENITEALDWKTDFPEGKIVVTGCLTQWDKKRQYIEKFPEVDLWLGIDELTLLPEIITDLYSQKKKQKHVICNKYPKYLYNDKTPRLQLTPAHYANIKIAEGCNNRCAYCSIPGIRGSLRSRTQSSIIKEAKSLIKNGVKELLIIAQDTTAFGSEKKNNEETLATLLTELDKIEGNHWIRVHYLHPEGITDDIISVLANSEHIIPYLDIPLQHISNNMLNKMNRRISSEQIKKTLKKLRCNIPKLIIRTTFLTGFPGETEEEFNELKKFIIDWKFERLGVFPFYPEPDTKAENMENQIPFELAQKRAEILYNIHKQNSLNFNNSLIGHKFDVIVDVIENENIIGRTYMDSPEIDNTVVIKSKNCLSEGDLVKIKITCCNEFELTGIEI